jgi:putative spermidine/putrescine transport system permease protein
MPWPSDAWGEFMFDSAGYRAVVGTLAWAGIAFLIFPVIVTVMASFEPSSFIAFPPSGFSLKWYSNISAISRIWPSTWVSFETALVSASIATLLAALASMAIVRSRIPGSAALIALLASPASLPMVALGMALIQFFIAAGMAFTWTSLVVAHVVLVLAYPLRTIASSLMLADRSQEHAAATLGASPFVTFATVTLPNIAPGIVSGFIFSFLISFDNYPISLFLVRGNLSTMPIELFSYINQNLDPTPAAFSTVYMLVVTIVIALAERRFRIISLSIPG